MHNASEIIRRVCLSLLLACALVGSALPAAASVRGAVARKRHAAISVRRNRIRAHVHRSHSRRRAESSYTRASFRIPIYPQASRISRIPAHFLPRQSRESRGNRQSEPPPCRESSGTPPPRHRRRRDALTNRATGATRTISADAEGVFRLSGPRAGNILVAGRKRRLRKDDARRSAPRCGRRRHGRTDSNTCRACRRTCFAPSAFAGTWPPGPQRRSCKPAVASYREFRQASGRRNPGRKLSRRKLFRRPRKCFSRCRIAGTWPCRTGIVTDAAANTRTSAQATGGTRSIETD